MARLSHSATESTNHILHSVGQLSSQQASPVKSLTPLHSPHTGTKIKIKASRTSSKYLRRAQRKPSQPSPLIPSNGSHINPYTAVYNQPHSTNPFFATDHSSYIDYMLLQKRALFTSNGAMQSIGTSTGALQTGLWPSLLGPPPQYRPLIDPFALSQLLIASQHYLPN